jgi:hypothetical protein
MFGKELWTGSCLVLYPVIQKTCHQSVPWKKLRKLHPFSIYTTKSSDFSNFCGVIGYNFFLL